MDGNRPSEPVPRYASSRPPSTSRAIGACLTLLVAALGFGACADASPTLMEVPEEAPSATQEADSSSSPDSSSSAGSAYPNQPSGFTAITEHSFSTTSENGWRSSSSLSIAADATAPRSPGSVGVVRFPAGFQGGESPTWSYRDISGGDYTRVYVSFWLKLSEGWQGHSSGVNKIGFVWAHGKPVVYPNILGTGSGRLGSEIRIQDVPDGAQNLAANVSDVAIQRGKWHRWEVVLIANTGGQADGEVHWWIDGRKAGAHQGVRFASASQEHAWSTVTWRPIWGGRGDAVETPQSMSMDHYYLSGRP